MRYFTISWKILHHVDVNGSKKLWQGCSLCNILSSFNKQSVNIWEMRRPVTGPLVEECCPIVGWYRILAAKQSWVFIVVFYVSWCAKCFWVLDCHAGLRTRGAKASKIDFQLCLLHMMSSASLKLLQSLCNSTLRNIIWNCSSIFKHNFFGRLLHLCRETVHYYYTFNHVTDLFPNNIICCNMFIKLGFFGTTYFSSRLSFFFQFF